ncbi:MAG: xanthine phosphoribosyltransferase, partial [Firmicutes bacterium]|nr:xanthine phosphoribosyltransferase [Candidatus Colimorpha enterica]
MKLLEDRILKDGKVFPGEVLKVDSFINHQIDVPFAALLADEFHRLFENDGVNKILTIEASGIGIASLVAERFSCPLVFAKKSRTSNLGNSCYTAEVVSYTHNNTNTVLVSKDY